VTEKYPWLKNNPNDGKISQVTEKYPEWLKNIPSYREISPVAENITSG